MAVDINERVLAAFQMEHKEFLEGIRSLMGELQSAASISGDPRLDEAYRQAHSLKGGARVCDLRPIETLGHQLETVLEGVRKGRFPLDRATREIVNLALDAIEDWMAALAKRQSPVEPAEALARIRRFVEGKPEPVASSPADQSPALRQRLLAAFRREQHKYVESLRNFLATAAVAAEPDSDTLDEALRIAHSLKEASRVAGISTVESLGRQLESLLAAVRDGRLDFDESTQSAVSLALDAVTDDVAALEGNGTPSAAAAALQALDRLLNVDRHSFSGARPEEATPGDRGPGSDADAKDVAKAQTKNVDLVRLSAERLDRVLRSSGQLLSESLRQDQVARELTAMNRQIDEIDREWELVRKSATASLHHLGVLPEFARIVRFLDFTQRQVRGLSRQARRVRLLQRRSAWTLQALGGDVQNDVKQARMAPAESVFLGFRKMVRDLARDEGKEIDFQFFGADVQADRMVLQALKDPVMHMLRNAVIHGIEPPGERAASGKERTARVLLQIESLGHRLLVRVEDDGRGVDSGRVMETALRRGLVLQDALARPSEEQVARWLFQPGFSTSRVVTELSGRGMGLSVVQESVSRLQGDVQLRPRAGGGTSILINVPLSISTCRMLLTGCGGQKFAIPLHGVKRLIRVKLSELETIEARPIVTFEGQPVPLVNLAYLLGIGSEDFHIEGDVLCVAILKSGTRQIAAAVDLFIGETDALIQNLDGPARKNARFAGGILLEDGSVVLVVNPAELLSGMRRPQRAPAVRTVAAPPEPRPATILIVDDSFTTRTLEKSILEAHGFNVRVAVDGEEALAQLRTEPADLVITDIQMPRLDGFGLLERMKRDEKLSKVPVILVTSLDKREDQARGLDLGAEAYIVKRKFDHQDLLNTIRQFV